MIGKKTINVSVINTIIADIEADRELTLKTTNLSEENKKRELLIKELENKIYDEVVEIIKKQVKI